MKIAQVISFMSLPPLDGMSSVVYNLSKELSKCGHDITIITSTKENHETQVESEEIRIVFTPSIAKNPFLLIPRSLKGVIKEIDRHKLIHVHSVYSGFSSYVSSVAKLRAKPLVTSVLSYLCLTTHPNLLVRLSSPTIESIVSISLKFSDAIHAKGFHDYLELNKRYKNVYLIPDGIADYYFSRPKDSEPFLKKVNLTGTEKIILYIGRIHPVKGLHILIKSMVRVIKKHPDAFLVIIGMDQGFRGKLERLTRALNLNDKVLFLGPQSERIKISAYDAAKLVVVPTISDFGEAFSLVASEAWARGKPVVASAVGAPKFRVKPGVNGYLARPNNSISLAQAIVKALDLYSVERPDDVVPWSYVAKSFERVYREILG